jgi:hypothetical protein
MGEYQDLQFITDQLLDPNLFHTRWSTEKLIIVANFSSERQVVLN